MKVLGYKAEIGSHMVSISIFSTNKPRPVGLISAWKKHARGTLNTPKVEL